MLLPRFVAAGSPCLQPLALVESHVATIWRKSKFDCSTLSNWIDFLFFDMADIQKRRYMPVYVDLHGSAPRHADFAYCKSYCILVKLRFTDRHRGALNNWRIRLVVYGARLESVLV